MNPTERKKTWVATAVTGTAYKVAQNTHKDSLEGSKVADDDKRRRVWQLPEARAFAC